MTRDGEIYRLAAEAYDRNQGGDVVALILAGTPDATPEEIARIVPQVRDLIASKQRIADLAGAWSGPPPEPDEIDPRGLYLPTTNDLPTSRVRSGRRIIRKPESMGG